MDVSHDTTWCFFSFSFKWFGSIRTDSFLHKSTSKERNGYPEFMGKDQEKHLPNESNHCCLTLSGGQGLALLTLASKVRAVLGLGQEVERSDLSPSSMSIQVPLGLENLPGISPFPLQSINLPGAYSCLESKDCVSVKALGSHDPLSLKCLQLQLWK